jgi:hypothetical protein
MAASSFNVQNLRGQALLLGLTTADVEVAPVGLSNLL